MKANETKHMFEVDIEELRHNIYVVADERHEVIQTIGEKYDTDNWNLDWSNFVIVGEVEDSLGRVLSKSNPPYKAIWRTDSGDVRGMESRTNGAGANSLYWI